MGEIKELPTEFAGKGEVSGYCFTQILKSDKAYIYAVDGGRHYEVFKRKVNRRFSQVRYPNSNSFGVWAWTCRTYGRALKRFEELNQSKS
ncbi:hypothetical protein [Moheibacter stercoris]|uniref:KTSC domain-containing protein n=1 Tax=Moheibacter stercoris TaxID=1628251 RepID=A0ABV2LWJ9_9FLAO